MWTLEHQGRRFLNADPIAAAAELRRLDGEVRKAARKRDLSNAPRDGSSTVDDDLGEVIGQDDGDTETADWSSQLLARMMALKPDAFERLAQRLLREAGFRNVEVTGRSGDNGIDGVGVYRPSLVSFPIYFQCKRYAGSVGSREVRDFRGAMTGRGEKGLLITTGTFTAEARKEATRDGAPPVDLVDGAALCELLKEYSVGVRSEMVEQIHVEFFFFESL